MLSSVSRWVAGVALLFVGCEEQPPAKTAANDDVPRSTRASSERSLAPSEPGFWVRRCFVDGQGDVCRSLGFNYAHGGSTPWGYFPQDDTKAATAHHKACDLGVVESCAHWGSSVITGKGTAKDQQAGFTVLSSACEKGSTLACGQVGLVLVSDLGSDRDERRGKALLKIGCEGGGPGASVFCRELKEVAGTQRVSSSSPPTGAVGFLFGVSKNEVQRQCLASHHKWESRGKNWWCSGTVTPGLPYEVVATFCNDRLCEIGLIEWVSDLAQLPARYDATAAQLEQRYGPVFSRSRESPAQCLASANAFLQCQAGKTWNVTERWVWVDAADSAEPKFTLYLTAFGNSQGTGFVFVSYTSPESFSQKTAPSGL